MAENALKLLLGRPVGKEHMEDLLELARAPRMLLNLAEKLNEQ